MIMLNPSHWPVGVLGDASMGSVSWPAEPVRRVFRGTRIREVLRLLVDVAQALLAKSLPHAERVQAELARLVALARGGLLAGPGPRGVEHIGGPVAGDHDHAVVVGDDDVARRDELARAHERKVDVAQRLL